MKVCQSLLLGICLLFSMVVTQHLNSQDKSGHAISLLILTGGHAFEHEAFFEMFSTFKDITFREIVHPAANEIYANGMADKADILIFYDMMQVISPEQKDAMTKLLERGKPCLFLHHALVSYQDWPEFEQIIGGKYIVTGDSATPASTYRHDVEFSIYIKDPNHPITHDIRDFKICDEVYCGFRILATSIPLLTTDHVESSPVIAWTRRYGNSPIVYIQPGHDHRGYENPNYRKLIYNAIIWLSGDK